MPIAPRVGPSSASISSSNPASVKNPLSERELLSHLAVAERVVTFVCAHYLLTGDEKEEFSSHVTLKLLEDDHAILRKFEGRSSIRTYLGTVIGRLYKDYRNAAWGKWRPSAEATRSGEIAILLERLLTRDGHTFEEAYELITTNHRLTIPRQDLEELAGRLPVKLKRRFEGEDALLTVRDQTSDPEETLVDRARAEEGRRILGLLKTAREGLPERDQLLLTLRYEDGRSVAEISLMMREDQKALYRHFGRLLAGVGERLQAQGISAADITDLFEDRPRRAGREEE